MSREQAGREGEHHLVLFFAYNGTLQINFLLFWSPQRCWYDSWFSTRGRAFQWAHSFCLSNLGTLLIRADKWCMNSSSINFRALRNRKFVNSYFMKKWKAFKKMDYQLHQMKGPSHRGYKQRRGIIFVSEIYGPSSIWKSLNKKIIPQQKSEI